VSVSGREVQGSPVVGGSPTAASSPAAAIEVTGVVKRYAGRAVLDSVDLRVAPGEIVALLGPNGAGKTTLVEIVEGYRRADAGEVRVLGETPDGGGRGLKARVGLMLQAGGLDPRTTPADVLGLYAAFFEGGPSPAELLRLVGLDGVARTRVRRLSGGERQRLALALALAGEPEVLVLDEPTAGMDPEARRATRELIAGLRREGRAILLTTHDLGDVERLADRVTILDRGRVRATGSPSELMQGAARELRFRLHDAPSAEAIARLTAGLGGPGIEPDPAAGPAGRDAAFRLVDAGPTADLVAAIAAWAAREGLLIVELRAGSASLEDRYLELTGDRDVEVDR